MDVNDGDSEEIDKILSHLENVNFLPGPILQRALRLKAESLVGNKDEEQVLILNLVESHIPGLRLKAYMEFDGNLVQDKTEALILQKHHLYFSREHPLSLSQVEVNVLHERLAELPKEWTVVQITPQFSSDDIFTISLDNVFTSGIHLTVFNCGQNEEPYCVSLLKEGKLTCRGDLRNLKNNLKEVYSAPLKKGIQMMSQRNRMNYHKARQEMEDTLEGILHDLEEYWLGAWKCLLIGKYKNESLELKIIDLLDKYLNGKSLSKVSKKVQNILVQAVKGTLTNGNMTDKYVSEILEYCFPSDNLKESWKLYWRKHLPLCKEDEERYPVILIVDETLDAFPWEMISTLKGHPSSRMPSLHLLYAIFKAHEDSIVGGYKIVSNSKNGKYILNPGLDLESMETRLKTFFQYWLPDWSGMIGKAPTPKEFIDFLTSGDIFCYSGHGSGAQYCSSDKIQKKKINSVVFLFGCGSTQLIEQGPEVEMYGTSQMFLLAACPCLIGMLWVVTDLDTDMLTTSLLSTWIPNSEKTPWHSVDQREWRDSGKVLISDDESCASNIHEPDLLKALCLARKKMKYNCNIAATVARGIPVKLVS